MAYDGLDDELVYAGKALPTPTDTPYRTPSRSMSRRSSRYGASSPGLSSSPPPLPPDHSGRGPIDAANDENISILDPRRFTPTLHASLVSEILSLRRDLDSKTGLVESLENSLQTTRNEHDKLDETFAANTKETRSLRRQLQLLEGGTSSALGELAKERDEAVDNVAELKKRLESSNKRIHAQDNDAETVQELWEKDKDRWDNDRRALERRVHISEGRLKAVVEEVAAHQAALQAARSEPQQEHESDAEDNIRSSVASFNFGHRKGLPSLNSLNNEDLQSVRSLAVNGVKGDDGARVNGLSLADELAMDEDEEDDDGEDIEVQHKHGSRQYTNGVSELGSTTAGRHERNDTLSSNKHEANGHANHDLPITSTGGEDPTRPTKQTPVYVDTGVQFSPPASPRSPAPDKRFIDETKSESPVPFSMDIEANQRRKRVAMGTPAGYGKEQTRSAAASPETVPTSSHSSHEPLSPPRTPKVPERAPPPPPPPAPPMVSSSTQTDFRELAPPKRSPLRPVGVPSINIRPPTPGSSSQRKPVLPPQTKSIACQASIELPRNYRSVTVQTEGIRVDPRTSKLPAHLLPSAIPVGPAARESLDSVRSKSGAPLSPSTTSPRSTTEYPGNNDNGLLRSGKTNKIRRPFRSSSLFAGFDAPSSDEGEDYDKNLDDHYHTRLSAPKPPARKQEDGSNLPNATTVSNDERLHKDTATPDDEFEKDDTFPTSTSPPTSSPSKKLKNLNHRLTINTGKQPNIRKSALITSGTAAHVQRARSPSLGDRGKHASGAKEPIVPPFPVPTRSSSRKLPLSTSDGTGSPTFKKSMAAPNHNRRDSGRPSFQKRGLRKVRSAAAISGVDQGRRPRSRSPPPLSVSTIGSDVPKLPPIPRDEITTPLYAHERQPYTHHHQFSTNTSTTAGASAASSQPTGVVDAIAQTMVGEWMWKYVRRRKSFGVSDSPQIVTDQGRAEDTSVNISSNGLRHKRWVWLAPYERAVMWSSKQPTSGTALLGKSGRKLTIQSVLDVKDDTPGPKNAGSLPLFNRSILILTSARALKFTASTKERHYLWLMALSFLSDSSQGANELVSLPPPIPVREYEPPPRKPGGGLRRNPIKDSIRIAKGKARPGSRGNPAATAPPAPRQPVAIQPPILPETNLRVHGSIDEPIEPSADPPNVPRFSNHHSRKRSNTGSWLPASGFRGPSSNYSFGTNASSDQYATASQPGAGFGMTSGPSSFSRRTSEVSGRSSVATGNFFDAVGTVRMEAFVQRSTHLTFNEEDEHLPSHPSYNRVAGGTRDGRWNGNGSTGAPSVYEAYHNRFNNHHPASHGDFHDHHARTDDPFRGF
ncbi:MAG: hypothetical protein M4579_006359 [Chaenotheca gracillima]|nr:MAG: hypothetical protein M4579_006359 [Chaenotheca gracillima]